MRYWLFSVVALVFLVAGGNTQEAKKKDKEDAPVAPPAVAKIAGLTFNQWAKQIDSPDPTKREVAMKTILNFHPEKAYEVLPSILKQLQRKQVDLSVRVNGTLVLATVFRYKKDPDNKYLVDAVAIFKTAIKDHESILKIRSMQALPFLGPISREAMGEVINAISDPTTYETREVAIQTLATLVMYDPKKGLGQYQKNAVAALLGDKGGKGSLEDSSYLVRRATLQTLVPIGHIVPEADRKHILARIAAALDNEIKKEGSIKKDGDSSVIIQAHTSIINLKRKAIREAIDSATTKDHLEPIVQMIHHSDPTTRLNALQSIGGIGQPAQAAAVKTVLSAIHDSDVDIAISAVATLYFLEAFQALPELKKLSADKIQHPDLKEAVEDTIAQLEYLQKAQMDFNQKKEKGAGKK